MNGRIIRCEQEKRKYKIINDIYQERTQCIDSLLPANYNILTAAAAVYNA
jgi:hypothetical protein